MCLKSTTYSWFLLTYFFLIVLGASFSLFKPDKKCSDASLTTKQGACTPWQGLSHAQCVKKCLAQEFQPGCPPNSQCVHIQYDVITEECHFAGSSCEAVDVTLSDNLRVSVKGIHTFIWYIYFNLQSKSLKEKENMLGITFSDIVVVR